MATGRSLHFLNADSALQAPASRGRHLPPASAAWAGLGLGRFAGAQQAADPRDGGVRHAVEAEEERVGEGEVTAERAERERQQRVLQRAYFASGE